MENNTYISNRFVNAPFAVVWGFVADPLNFPDLFPNRVAEIVETGDLIFAGLGPNGNSFTLTAELSYDHGVADFRIIHTSGEEEWLRMRLFDVDDGCLLSQIAHRRPYMSDEDWEHQKTLVDDDMAVARETIEGE